jgi:putative DNA primase/helicase
MPMTIKSNAKLGKSSVHFQNPDPKQGVLMKFHVDDLPVNLTEDDVAGDFAREYRDSHRFDHDLQRWYIWNGVFWQVNGTGLAFDHARQQCRKHRGSQRTMGSKRAADGVEYMARRDRRLAVTAKQWDTDPLLLGTPGGTVDLRTGELKKPDPQAFITKVTAVPPAASGIACPHFKQFLVEATDGDKELQRLLQQMAGYCLTGLISEHALFFIYGPGGNGKSVLQNVLSEIMGDYSSVAAMEVFAATRNPRHLSELAMLRGARLVTASETESTQKWSEARVNRLTGGDAITANFMRQDHFTYHPQFKLMFVGNHKPQLGTVNDAARRRFNIIPFLHKPKKPDQSLPEKLRSEYPAILRWAIEGCVDWQANGLIKPSVVTKATADYFDEQDLFGRWIDERCECGPGLQASSQELYFSWELFAKANGEEPGTATVFGAKLPERGFQRKKSGKTFYVGIKLKNNAGDLPAQGNS